MTKWKKIIFNSFVFFFKNWHWKYFHFSTHGKLGKPQSDRLSSTQVSFPILFIYFRWNKKKWKFLSFFKNAHSSGFSFFFLTSSCALVCRLYTYTLAQNCRLGVCFCCFCCCCSGKVSREATSLFTDSRE